MTLSTAVTLANVASQPNNQLGIKPTQGSEKQSLLRHNSTEERVFFWNRFGRNVIAWVIPSLYVFGVLMMLLYAMVVLPQQTEFWFYSPTMCYVCNSTQVWQNDGWIGINVIGYDLYNSTTVSPKSFDYYTTIISRPDSSPESFLPGNWFACYYNMLNYTQVIPQRPMLNDLMRVKEMARLIPLASFGFYIGFVLIFLASLSCCVKGVSAFLLARKAVIQGFVHVESLGSIESPLYRSALLWALETHFRREHPLTTTAVTKETIRIVSVQPIDGRRCSTGNWIIPSMQILGLALVCFVWTFGIHFVAPSIPHLWLVCLLGTWLFLGVQFAIGVTVWAKENSQPGVVVTTDNNLSIYLSGGEYLKGYLRGILGVCVAIQKLSDSSRQHV